MENSTIQKLLLQSFEKNSDQTAIEHSKGKLSYNDLINEATAIAEALLKSSSGDNVGIYLSDHTQVVKSMIGVFLAGKTFVPLDVANVCRC